MIDHSNRPLASTRLGGEIRTRRADLGLTLAAISQRTGLSPSFLSQLENGRTSTSLRSLEAIADALDTTVNELLARADQHEEPICRADTPSPVEGCDIPAGDSVRARSLAHGRRTLRALEVTGRADDDREFHHRHDEILYVAAGSLVVTFGEPAEVAELSAGDSLYLTAGTPHRWRGLSDETKAVLVTIAEDRRVTRAR